MCFQMRKIVPTLSHLDIFKKTFDKIKIKKQFTNYFARKMIVKDSKSWVFAEIVCRSN